MKLTALFVAAIVGLNAPLASAEPLAQTVSSSAEQFVKLLQNPAAPSDQRAKFIALVETLLKKAPCERSNGRVDCSQATQAKLETAQADLQRFRDDWGEVLKQAAAGQALGLTFAANVRKVQLAIGAAKLAADARAPFNARLTAITNAAKCAYSPMQGLDCSQAPPDKLSPAQEALDRLQDDLNAALKQAAAVQALGQTFAANVRKVQLAIGDPKLPFDARAPFSARLTAITNAAKCAYSPVQGLDCSQAPQDKLSSAQQALDRLSGDVAQAAAQSAPHPAALTQSNTPPASQTFAASAVQFRSALIDASLSGDARAPLISQFVKILNAAHCTSTANAVDCSQASRDQLATAQSALQPLRDGYAAAVKQAAADLALAQGAFAAKVGMVVNALNDPKMGAVKATFLPQFNKVLNAAKCTSTAKSADCSQATLAQLAAAQGDLETLSLEVGTIAALKQAGGGLSLSRQAWADKAGRLLVAINAVRMDPAVRTQLVAQFAHVLSEANCTNTAKGVDCSQAEESQLTGAQDLFERLSYQVQIAPGRP